MIFCPNGPGRIASDGYLAMKWPWYRMAKVTSSSTATGRCPGPADARSGRAKKVGGYEKTKFHPSKLVCLGEAIWLWGLHRAPG